MICNDPTPNKMSLTTEFGVACSVIREALSRLKMMGLISNRPRKGMVLTEPSILGGMRKVIDLRIMSTALLDILGFRIALEEGITSDIFRNITPEDISEQEEIIHPVLTFVKERFCAVNHTKD